jgi:hypothetical protein
MENRRGSDGSKGYKKMIVEYDYEKVVGPSFV